MKHLITIFFLTFLTMGSHSQGNNSGQPPNYPGNRAPLTGKTYIELPVGAIRPQGWLKEQLNRMRTGMTGHLDSIYPQVAGQRNGWLGGDGDVWERGPYWIDGLLPLDNIKAQIIRHYQRLSDREAFVTAEMVRNAFQGIGTEYETLLGAFDKDNESFRKRIGTDRALSSYKVRVRSRNHLAAFIRKRYNRSDISMLELTPDFIKEYEIHLSTEAGLHNGSVWSNCMWVKTIVAKAHYNGLIPRNPFAQYRVSQNIKEREYLTEDEIKAVMTHEFADKKLAYIRDLFVFASFTALSFVDIKELTTDDIVKVNGEKWILSKRHKTKVNFQVKRIPSVMGVL